MSSKTSIILCTYNEANYIEKAISELEKNIPNVEIIIVDDCSTDGTIEIIKKLNQSNKYKVIYRKRSRSLASAFVRGVIETTGESIGWIDTNMSEVAPKFPEMIQALQSDNDIVVLSRYVEGGGDNRILLRKFTVTIS
jgi:dolichol-phosphate mannosyltransferase